MTFHVYAITDSPDEPLPNRPGLDDRPLAQVVCRDICAVVSAHEGAIQPVEADQLWRHEEVIEALMIRRTVAPARFGTFLSRQRLGEILARTYPQLVADLAYVRGHVEIGVRFLTLGEPDTPEDTASRVAVAASGPTPGTTYLLTKLSKERGLRDLRDVRLGTVREVFAMLKDLATAGRLDDPGDRHVVSAAFLVARDRIQSFQHAVAQAADTHPQLAALCTGPWPPYSFVSTSVSAETRQLMAVAP